MKLKSIYNTTVLEFYTPDFSTDIELPVPAINKQTLEFENINYLEHKDSGKYLFYTDADLKGDNDNNYTIDNFDLKLNTLNNYCPNCKQKELDFMVTMFID